MKSVNYSAAGLKTRIVTQCLTPVRVICSDFSPVVAYTSYHIRQESFEVLHSLFSFVLLPFPVDLLGLLRAKPLHCPLSFPQAGFDPCLLLQLLFLL